MLNNIDETHNQDEVEKKKFDTIFCEGLAQTALDK